MASHLSAGSAATTLIGRRLLNRRFLQIVLKKKLTSGKVMHWRRRRNGSNGENQSLVFMVKAEISVSLEIILGRLQAENCRNADIDLSALEVFARHQERQLWAAS